MNDAVVQIWEKEPDIVQITMNDQINKNTFSPELTAGVIEAFKTVRASSTYKVVILTGYGNYFASGGTRDGLLALHEGQGGFDDNNLYSLALECDIPVIAAMQGHGIGGGFVMGMFSDFVIFSRESVYTANFMKFGFTPGMGATYILPKKLGFSLGHEMLISAKNYRGAELETRGCPFRVFPRAQVLEKAWELAREIAEKPRFSLITLKAHLVASLREQLPDIIEKELVMHAKTLPQTEVRERIMKLFGN